MNVNEYRRKYPQMREGQIFFNVFSDMWPDKVQQVTATEVDPFYDDARIPAFINFLVETV